MENNSLQHWGVRGMKWGVRRYQNKDGTLTPLGRKRAASLASKREKYDSEYNSLVGIKPKSQSVVQAPQPQKRSVSDLSDDELRARINRLQMEKQLADLTRVPEVKKGKNVVGGILAKSGQAALATVSTAAFTYLGKQAIKKMAGDDVYTEMFKEKKKDKD